MEQGVRIRLYGKPGCKQCDLAKEKLKKLHLAWEFVDVAEWMDYSDDWRSRLDETVGFHTAYSFYYPMPLPLFRFDDEDYLGYSEGLRRIKDIAKAMKKVEAEQSAAPVLEAVA